MTMTTAQKRARATKRTAAVAFYVPGVATIAANMYASTHTPIGLATGFWTPVALFLGLELLERVPMKGWSGVLRKVGVGALAVVAAWVSYWHLVDIFALGGADAISAHAMPLTVDLLMGIARSTMIHRAPAAPVARKKPVQKKSENSLRVVKAG